MIKIDYTNYYWQDELVRLRALQPEDWQLNMQMEFDSVARRRLQYEQELPPTEDNRKAATERFANFKPESGRLMFVIETLDGKPVGIFNLNSIDERHGTFSIGMQIFPAECGKGYGTAAMRILLRYAFDERRLHKYYGSVIEDNIASAAMLKKLGCVQEGVRREQIYMNGRYWNEILFGLTVEEFHDRNNR
jgi:RimJ/RimL family protein N-acetyltransferase